MFSPISEITASENTAHRRSLGNFRGFSHFAARFFYGNACAPEQSATVHQAQLMRGDIRLQLGFLFVSGKTLPQRVYDNDAENSEEDSEYDRREHIGGEVQV